MKPKIVFEDPSLIEALKPYIDRVLEAIAIDQPHALRAYVSSKTAVEHFYLVGMKRYTSASVTEWEYNRQLMMLSHRLGIEVTGSELLVDVAKQLRDKDER